MRTWKRWLGLVIGLNLAGWLSADASSNGFAGESVSPGWSRWQPLGSRIR